VNELTYRTIFVLLTVVAGAALVLKWQAYTAPARGMVPLLQPSDVNRVAVLAAALAVFLPLAILGW
jgi:hypothetical protein